MSITPDNRAEYHRLARAAVNARAIAEQHLNQAICAARAGDTNQVRERVALAIARMEASDVAEAELDTLRGDAD